MFAVPSPPLIEVILYIVYIRISITEFTATNRFKNLMSSSNQPYYLNLLRLLEKLQVTLYFLKFFDVTNIGTYRSQIFP